MTRRTYRYDPDADMVYEVGGNYFEERADGPAIHRDELPGGIHGMRSHADGRMYDSKSKYLADVRARGLVVVGNEDTAKAVRRPDPIGRREIGETIKRAFEEVRSYGPDAARRARMLSEGK